MRAKRFKSFLFAVILAFESIAVGVVPAQAQAVSENTVEVGVETEIDCESQGTDNVAEVVEATTEVPAEKVTIVHSGKNGALDWSIDSDGHLTISGTGNYASTSTSSTNSWLTYSDEIKTATVNVTGITNTSYMFSGCSNMTSLDLSGLDTSNVIDMSSMFNACGDLTTLDLSGFDTSSVTDMGSMFMFCISLTTLDVSGFDTSNVTDMTAMFCGCNSLTSLNLTGVDTSSVTKATLMFFQCGSLTTLDVSGFDTSSVTDMSCMFAACSSLTSLDLSGFDTSSLESMYSMFENCRSLTTLDVSGCDTSNVVEMSNMFSGCTNLVRLIAPENKSTADMELPVTDYDWKYRPTGEIVTKVTKAGIYMTDIKRKDGVLSWELDTNGHLTVTGNGDYTARSDESTESGWLAYKDEIISATINVTGIKNTSYMFSGCSNLTNLDLTGLDTSNVTDMSAMLKGCNNLIQIIASENKSTEDMELPVTDCAWKYEPTGEGVTKVTEAGTYMREKGGTDGDQSWKIDFNGHLTVSGNGDYAARSDESTESGWLAYKDEIKSATINVTGITDTSYMFFGCSNLTSLDLSGLDTSNVIDMSSMFDGCDNLTHLIAPENKSTEDMELPVTDYDWKYQPTGETVTKVTKAGTYMREKGGTDGDLPWELDINGHLTVSGNGDYATRSNESTESGWLAYKDEIISATINITGITDMSYMFSGCINLTSLDLTGLDTSNVTDMSSMFDGCDNLSQLITSENQSETDMCLPVSPDYIWKYESTGETVTKVTKAGTYIREDKPDESVVETPPTSGEDENVDTSEPSAKKERKVETKVEIKPDGSVTKTETITEPNGEVTIKVISTSKDQKKETIVIMKFNASGQLIDVAIEVVHVVKSSKMTINLKELKALVDQVLLGNTAYIYPLGSDSLASEKVDSLGAFRQSVQDSLGAAQEKPNVTIKLSAKNSSGQKKYSVAIQKKDLTKKKFVVFASDKNDNAVMVNTKKNTAKVNKKKDLTIKIAKKGNYQLQNAKDAKKTNKKIIKTVKPMKKSITIKKGKKASFELSAKCNKDNIQKITYSSNSSSVKVNKKGKMQAKSKGTAKITATVTMKNGKKKKIKMKVKVS